MNFQRHLNNPLLKPEWVHIKRNGKTIPTDDALHSKNVQLRHLYFMDKEIINQEIDKGAALVLEGLDILDPSINSFCSTLEKGLPCGMANSVVFFSQKGNEAYEPHADTNDVIVVQLEGRKTWKLYERRQRSYLGSANLSDEQGPVKYELTLRPGDALYILYRCTASMLH
jgi:ribosomal protein L16 Arg81 hydroxylase